MDTIYSSLINNFFEKIPINIYVKSIRSFEDKVVLFPKSNLISDCISQSKTWFGRMNSH